MKFAAQTADRLESAAKNRALSSQIGVAMLAGVAAAAVASAHTTDTYRSRLRTPHGTHSWVSSYRDNSIGTIGAIAAVGAGGVGIASIQQRLDATLAEIGDRVVQRTTIDPAESYGGRVILEKIKGKGSPRDVRLAIQWNGEVYRFGLHIPKKDEAYSGSVRAASTPSRNVRSVAIEQPSASPAAITPVTSPVQDAPGLPAGQPISAQSSTNT